MSTNSSAANAHLKQQPVYGVLDLHLDGSAGGKRFDGIGVVNGGGATSVLLKDYPEPQRSQILDLVFKPKFGASVSALFVEIPGDGNATQGSMPSHMHTRDDLNYFRGYTWWILSEAQKRNPKLTLDGTAWSAPGWVGQEGWAEGEFWSQDAADYYVKWLQGLRDVYGLEFAALGCRNEKGESFEFVKRFRAALNANGFANVKLHAFDHWPDYKFDWAPEMLNDPDLRAAVDIIGAHVLERTPASAEIQRLAEELNKPIWDTEEHVYLKGFDCAISIVRSFNLNFIRSGATKVVNWYDIAGVYPMQPYSEDPSTILAHWPWSGHYEIREALWGYAHYGQFTEIGWEYLSGGSGELAAGGSYVTLKSPDGDYSIIIETKEATGPQQLQLQVSGGLSEAPLCVWRSNAAEQFVQLPDIFHVDGKFSFTLEPNTIYSFSTATGQQKGGFEHVPASKPFPFPYHENFVEYEFPEQWGYLPRYTADIAGAFELVKHPGGTGLCLRQVVPIPTISWAPDWRPYTIFGDVEWQDYEVSAEVFLNDGDTAGIMGRVNHVGTGYGIIPKGYFLELDYSGQCRLVVVRGKAAKQEVVGDAEQQAIIKARNDSSEGGEKVLATAQVDNFNPNVTWHTLKLRFEGTSIAGFVDGLEVVRAEDNLYTHGMAGLVVGQDEQRTSTPYFDLLRVTGLDEEVDEPTTSLTGQTPIYAPLDPQLGDFFRKLNAGVSQTVVLYGTSLTHTAEWPLALKEHFEYRFPGQVTFINAAQSGQHSNWGLANLEERVLVHHPDLVFLEFSVNDAATKHGISLEQSEANLNRMVTALRNQNPNVALIIQTMNPCWDSPREPQGKKSATDRPNVAAYYALYGRYARRNGFPLVDHFWQWNQLREQNEVQFQEWLPDGSHPTPEASRAVTWAGIRKLLVDTQRSVGR